MPIKHWALGSAHNKTPSTRMSITISKQTDLMEKVAAKLAEAGIEIARETPDTQFIVLKDDNEPHMCVSATLRITIKPKKEYITR